MDYLVGRIYKISNDIDDKLYIGSTTKLLKQRYQGHLETLKSCPNRKLYKHMIDIGIEHFNIELIETVEYQDKNELFKKENEYIKTLKPDLNNNRPVRSRKEYRDENKQEIKNKDKNYYLNNKDKILERVHLYASENKEKIKIKNKEYREKNKDKLKAIKSQKCICVICNTEYSHCHKARHERSKTHLNAMMK